MKSWFRSSRLRKSRSGSSSPKQSNSYSDIKNDVPTAVMSNQTSSTSKGIASTASSRLSIERYLSAPLNDEPVSVAVINAAIRRQPSQSRSVHVPIVSQGTPSRETSPGVNSIGQRTFYTSGSGAPDSTSTSYSAISKNDHVVHQKRSAKHHEVSELPKSESLYYDSSKVTLSPKSIISRTGNVCPTPCPTRVTDEMAYAQMVAQPKLAWILGGDVSHAKSTTMLKSSASILVSPMAERPSTSGTIKDAYPSKTVSRTKSSRTLDERVCRASTETATTGGLEQKASKEPKFYCTFCYKRFDRPEEWTEHEETIHMPEELWVCCPRIGKFPDMCPFCAKNNPSPSHLADHNYLSCQEKLLSDRTFRKKDLFLQHVAQVHKVSPGLKAFRLTELLDLWRHPLPLQQGHQALHCGFCGNTFATYKERTEHVQWHFMEGLVMMSWWNARVSHEHNQENPVVHHEFDVAHRCIYCERTYENRAVAKKLHPTCTMWSCSFLPGMQYTIYPIGSRSGLEAVCCYCNETLVRGDGKVKVSILKGHNNQHNFRNCIQRLYFSGQSFRQHLQDHHRTNFDGTLFAGWTLLVKSCRKEKPAMFEPQAPTMSFMDFSEPSPRSPVLQKKLRRKASVATVAEQAYSRERAGTLDPAYGATASLPSSSNNAHQHKHGLPDSSLPGDAVSTYPQFYRRRLDDSTRNRLYMSEDSEGTRSKKSQRLFREVPGSVFGGLVLHSSLVGAVAARLTNSVDVYPMH